MFSTNPLDSCMSKAATSHDSHVPFSGNCFSIPHLSPLCRVLEFKLGLTQPTKLACKVGTTEVLSCTT